MKLRKILIVNLLMVVGLSVGVVAHMVLPNNYTTASAAVIGDDYPAKWKNASQDSVIDSWGMYNRECTSFVAYRLSSANKFNLQRGGMDWNASNWGANAKKQGYAVNSTPAVGSVAWFGSKNHVAWVADISGSNVIIEDYNSAYNGKYAKRTVAKSSVSGFIHFKDLGASTPTPTPKPTPTKALKVYQVDEVKTANGILQVRCNSLVPVGFTWTQNGIPAADIDMTDAAGKKLADQNTVKKGQYFTINPKMVSSVSGTIVADGGYKWSKVHFTVGGDVWLKTTSANELLYK